MHNNSFVYLLYRGLNKFRIYLPRFIARFIAVTAKDNKKYPGAELIKLDTYDGSGQAVHPDVILTNGFMGYKYWMAVTPYPFSVDHFEKPCIFKSQDGLIWKPGGCNPVAFPTQRKNAHLSDPDMVWDEEAKQLRLFYRETQYKKRSVFNLIFTMATIDGAHWTPPAVIIKSDEDECLSPSVLIDDDRIEFFYVSTLNNKYQLMKKSFLRDFEQDGDDRKCRINNTPFNRLLWHIDIIKIHKQYIGLFVFASAPGGRGSKLYYATSMDYGLTWEMGQEIITDKTKKIFKNIYRGCLVPTGENADVFDFYFSAQLRDNSWHIFYQPEFTVRRSDL